MKVRIIESGKMEELVIVDPRTGMEWADDFIGNTGALNDGQFAWTENDDLYEVSQDNFDWWEKVMAEYKAADDAKYGLESELDSDEREVFWNDIYSACECALEDMPSRIMEVVKNWKNR